MDRVTYCEIQHMNPLTANGGTIWRYEDMKITSDTLKKLNQDSTHYTVGLNTFSLWSTIMLWAHFAGYFTWWALPLTVIAGLIGFGNEIQERKSNKNTITFK